MPEYVHALPPIDNRKGMDYADPSARCGGAGRVALFAEDVTCPQCLEQVAADTLRASLRTGVERAGGIVGSAVLDLSVWEGRGDWSALPAEQRDAAAVRALEHLDESIAALEARRAELRAALGADDDQADEDADPPIACALVHEHDPVTCAAPSIEELEAGGSQRPAEVVHYTTSSKANAECGAGWGAGYGDGTVSLWPAEVTCPQCKILIAETEA